MKLKYFVLGIFITVTSIILINIVAVNKEHNDIVYVKDIAGYGKIVTEFSKRLEKIKNEKCRSSLNSMLDYINKTHFEDNVTVEEYYQSYFGGEDNIITLLEDARNTCEIGDDDYDPIYVIALSSTNYPYKIKEKNLFSYELKLLDNYSRNISNKENDNTGTYTTKMLELKVLNDLLEVVE